ncbi:MAG: hypothetical protein PHD76_04960 [Methylacidiphilales bacterium]|nr:hypothetical protein [Candidatus Methylacidiphilales bacterium]
MNRLFLVFAGFLLLASFSGCASPDKNTANSDHEPTSTVPWNRPESWEGKGVLGGMMQ